MADEVDLYQAYESVLLGCLQVLWRLNVKHWAPSQCMEFRINKYTIPLYPYLLYCSLFLKIIFLLLSFPPCLTPIFKLTDSSHRRCIDIQMDKHKYGLPRTFSVACHICCWLIRRLIPGEEWFFLSQQMLAVVLWLLGHQLLYSLGLV